MPVRSPEDIHAAMYARVMDRLAVGLSRDFAAAGIDHLVLKGPAIANWLYETEEVRLYTDIDFLISSHDWTRAQDVLRAEGFEDVYGAMAHPRMESYASHPWRGAARGEVDMHATLEGLGVSPDVAWRLLSADREVLRLPEGEVQMLGEPGRLLHVALHASQHKDGTALADLQLALQRIPDERWARAAELADQLKALPAFVDGLWLVPAGRELAARLGTDDVRSVDTLLRARYIPLAEGLNELVSARGLRAKLRLLLSELVPKPEFMRWWSPLARRGSRGLALAYLWRPVWMLVHLPSALRALYEARRRARRS